MLAVGITIPPLPCAPSGVPVEFSSPSAMFDSLSAANYFIGSDTPVSNMGENCSLVIGYQHLAPTSDSVPWCAVGATSGWFLDGNATYLYANLRNPTLKIGTIGAHQYGYNVAAVSHLTGGEWRGCMNGDTAQRVVHAAGTTYVNVDATARELIGRCYAPVGSYPATKLPPLWCAYLTRALTDAERTEWTRTDRLDRFAPPAALLSDPSLVLLYTAEAWDGGVTLTPVVGAQLLTRTGAPTRTTLESEAVYAPPAAYYHDTIRSLDVSKRQAFARLLATTTANKAAALLHDGLPAGQQTAFLPYKEIGLRSNNVWVDELDSKFPGAHDQTIDASGLAAGAKSLEFIEGLRVQDSGDASANHGYTAPKVRVPASTPLTFIKPARPKKRIIALTDSIGEQVPLGIPARDSWTMLLRASLSADWGLTAACRGGGSVFSVASPAYLSATVARLAKLLDGTEENHLWFALEVNDQIYSLWGTDLAAYGAAKLALVDAVAALGVPGLHVYLASAILRTVEPVGPPSLQDYRDVTHACAAARPGTVDVRCEDWVEVTRGADGLHTDIAGSAAMAARIGPIIGIY